MGNNVAISPSHIRQIFDRLAHRLLFVPLTFVIGSVAVTQIMVWIDERLGEGSIPRALETTVEGGRAILSTIAGGLIASITLLLSLMLVAVQLGNTQFSPRTLRDWIGDRTQQVTIGVVLGTTVYCLLALRRIRVFEDGDQTLPHLTVLLAVALGVLSLIMVVRSVDHLANSLRIGSVAGRLTRETMALVERREPSADHAASSASPPIRSAIRVRSVRPENARVIESDRSGWVQQLDEEAVIRELADGFTIEMAVALGSYIPAGSPLAWLWPDGVGSPAENRDDAGEGVAEGIREAVAIGDSRTMQQDVGFGISQLVDIALRALSPGVNDPGTACDVIVHLGELMLAVWERPAPEGRRSVDGRTLITAELDHADHLGAAFDQIRRYGAQDLEVATTLVKALLLIRSEAVRRTMVGPIAPIDEMLELVGAGVRASAALSADKERVRALISGSC